MNPANNTHKKMGKETFKEVNRIFPRSPNTSDWESGVSGLFSVMIIVSSDDDHRKCL